MAASRDARVPPETALFVESCLADLGPQLVQKTLFRGPRGLCLLMKASSESGKELARGIDPGLGFGPLLLMPFLTTVAGHAFGVMKRIRPRVLEQE